MALQAGTNDQKDTNRIIGSRIREARARKDLTQAGLADVVKANVGSCSRQAIAQWERGVAMPSYSIMPELARALNVSPAWLSFGIADKDGAEITSSLRADALVKINQIEFGTDLTDRKLVSTWGLPEKAFKALGADEAHVFITKITGNAVSDDFSDDELVYINTNDTRPDGRAIAYWDGMGVSFAYASMIPSKSKPKVHLSGHGLDFKIEIDDIEIIGKVIGRIRLGS